MNIVNEKTLKELVSSAYQSDPQVLYSALDDYLLECEKFLTIKEVVALKEKLKDASYKEYFSKGIGVTSLFVLLTSREAMGPLPEEEESDDEMLSYADYTKEFLLLAKEDDADLSQAKLYYLSAVTSQEINLDIDSFDFGDTVHDEESQEFLALKAKIEEAAKKYDALREKVLRKYQVAVSNKAF